MSYSSTRTAAIRLLTRLLASSSQEDGFLDFDGLMNAYAQLVETGLMTKLMFWTDDGEEITVAHGRLRAWRKRGVFIGHRLLAPDSGPNQTDSADSC